MGMFKPPLGNNKRYSQDDTPTLPVTQPVDAEGAGTFGEAKQAGPPLGETPPAARDETKVQGERYT